MRTNALADRVHEIQTTGLTGAYEKAFRDLEEKLARAQGIVNARNATAASVTTLMELIEDLRYDSALEICNVFPFTFSVTNSQYKNILEVEYSLKNNDLL